VFDIRVTDTDSPSYFSSQPTKVLARHKWEKCKKYMDACSERRRHFSLIVFSLDGLPGKEALCAMKRIAAILLVKWDRTYSELCGFVLSRISIALARAMSL